MASKKSSNQLTYIHLYSLNQWSTGVASYRQNTVTWVGKIQPTPSSIGYKISLRLCLNTYSLSVKVTDPYPLKMYNNSTKLPHTYPPKNATDVEGYHKTKSKYRTNKQLYQSLRNQKLCDLCLYYPKDKEWNIYQPIGDYILPWAAEWLYYYEIWAITGTWLGPQVQHDEPTP